MEAEKILDFFLNFAAAYLECGSETYRCYEAVNYMFEKIGEGSVEVFTVPTQVAIDIITPDGKHHSGTKVVNKRGLDLNKVNKLNDLSRLISNGTYTFDDGVKKLNEIKESKMSVFKVIVGSAMSAALFSLLLGGGQTEFMFSLVGGLFSCQMSFAFKNSRSSLFLTNLAGGIISAIVAKMSVFFFPMSSFNVAVIASMLPLFPGISLITSVRDIITGDLISGMARFAESILVAVSLAVGASMIMYLVHF